MISGSAMGNVVATGVFTIPSMKRARLFQRVGRHH